MEFLHHTLIPYRTKSMLKQALSTRKSMNYREARKIGILFSMNNLEDFEAIRSFETKLKKDGKEVVVLCYLPKDGENFDFHYDFFSNKDFNFWGNIQADNIQQFLKHSFDLLICLDREPNFYLEYLLAATKARFRVGAHSQQREGLFELMIRQPEGSREIKELIQQIYHYTNEL
jgi:hypothetical protein